MLFNNNDGKSNDRILYQTKPNMLLGCKKAIYGVILLIVILSVSPLVIRLIGEMQVYMISQVKLPLTRYAAIAFFVVILINVVYIIWQLIGWYSMEYQLTESKIIIKSGVLSTKKNYMPYSTIQDINTSQSIFARLFNVGSVSVFSAYDNNQLELKNISNPSEVEEIIFSKMVGPRNFNTPPQSIPQYRNEEYIPQNDYYDEYEPITPIAHEKNLRPKRQYEYYPEDFNDIPVRPNHTYEYEPYDGGFTGPSNNFDQENHYAPVDEYVYPAEDRYNDRQPQDYYSEEVAQYSQSDEEREVSSEKVIRRHFDKFKK